MIGRRPAPAVPDDGDPTSVRLARITAAVDQALAAVDDSLRRNRGNAQLVDALLDVRLALRPPVRPS